MYRQSRVPLEIWQSRYRLLSLSRQVLFSTHEQSMGEQPKQSPCNTKMLPLPVFHFINIYLCFNTKHMFSNTRLLYLCLRSFLDKLFPLLRAVAGQGFKKCQHYIYFLTVFRGSLKKLSLEEHTQNDTTTRSALAGIHWSRLVLSYFSSDTLQGKETSPWKDAFDSSTKGQKS